MSTARLPDAPRLPPAPRLTYAPCRRGLIVLGPAVLCVLLGGWQMQRAVSAIAGLGQAAAQLAGQAARADAVAAVTPFQTFRFHGDPQTYGAALAAKMMHDGVGILQRDAVIEHVRVGLGLATASGGLVSLLAGIVGLAAAAWAARRSRLSRDALEAAFSRVRAILPVLLGCLVSGLALACCTALLFEMAGWFSTPGSETAAPILGPGLFLTGLAAWIGWLTLRQLRRSLAAFAPVPLPLLARAVLPDRAPGLWRFVAQQAAEQEAAMPDHVVIGLTEGFFVTAGDVALQPGGTRLQGRTLHVPLPVLAMLGPAETRAIIGHELAHFTSDTGYSLRFLPIYTGIARSLQALQMVRGRGLAHRGQGPAMTLGTHMMAVFDDAVKHWSRLREMAADRAGAQHCGPAAAASALIRTALLQPAIDTVLGETWRTPNAAPPDLVAAIVARAEAGGLGDPGAALAQTQPHPTDTHPPTSQRLQALGLEVTAPLLAEAARPVQAETPAFARSLFADWAGTCAAISADALGLAAAKQMQRMARLREIADQPTDALTEILPDWCKPAVATSGVALVFLAIGLVLAYAALTTPTNDPAIELARWTAAAGPLALAAGAVLRIGLLWRARRTPLMVLTEHGILCRGLDRALPWTGIAQLRAIQRRSPMMFSHLSVFIHLKPTTELPQRGTGGGIFGGGMVRWSVRVQARRRVVTLLRVRPRGFTPNAMMQTLHRYWSAAQARAALAEEAPAHSMVVTEEELQGMLSGDAC